MARVSVLMPTYKQAAFIRRAVESLKAQTFTDWELVIVNDDSPDDTEALIADYRTLPNVIYERLPQNVGIGAAFNHALTLARGEYIAYLPSDDVYYPEHLLRLVTMLEFHPHVYAAYGGARWNYETYSATLQGDSVVGAEVDALFNPAPAAKTALVKSGNPFALVQVMHRRDYEQQVRWLTRAEIVTDRLEIEYWRGLVNCGASFAYAGDITCEWVAHPDQHHKIVAGSEGGLSRYRQFYGIGANAVLNWQPSWGVRVDERQRFGVFLRRRYPSRPDGLKILLVGELGFNPERIVALEERGHRLYGLWTPQVEPWDTGATLPFSRLETIPFERGWQERVRAVQPDVIYALLNWQAIPMIYEVFTAGLGIPFVYHFKEGPFIAQEKGTWGKLIRLLLESDGRIFINPESCEWFQLATDYRFEAERTFILDGDLPKVDYFTDDWTPKLSDTDGEMHTVCAGRLIGMGEVDELAKAGIHVHFYGDHFHQMHPNTVRDGLATGYWHLHPTVSHADWTRELSQYDAAWFHVFESRNRGDLRRATWDDLNYPARLGGYAAAGLPFILKDGGKGRTALISSAQRHDIGVLFETYDDLAAKLRDRPRLRQLTANMRRVRKEFAFDTHADALIGFLRQSIEQAGRR
jgi:glycosyltransferase involved in cell wall biosynthesis